MNRLAPFVVAPLLLSACSTLSTEHQLVGTWTDHLKETVLTSDSGVQHSYSKQMVDLILYPDHRLAFWLRGQRSPDSIGQWHLEGRSLFIEFTRRPEDHKVRH